MLSAAHRARGGGIIARRNFERRERRHLQLNRGTNPVPHHTAGCTGCADDGLLNGAEFNGQSFGDAKAQSLIAQGQALLNRANGLPHLGCEQTGIQGRATQGAG